MEFRWNEEKNELLKKQRGVCFEDVVTASLEGDILHSSYPNNHKFPHQKMMIISMRDYVYCVPYIIEENGTLFLKTIFPSRKMYKLFISS